jgi:O-antigen/teichoic acid export membrane protein
MVATAPLLTRFYSPEDFGLLAVYVGLVGLVSVVASLRYQLAIPLPESDREAIHVVVLCVLIVVGMTILSGAIVVFAGDAIADMLGTPKLKNYFWLLPLGVLLIGVYQVFNYWAIRIKYYSSIAETRFYQVVTTLAVQLLGFKTGSFALLLGYAGGQGVGSFTLGRSALARPEIRQWTWKDLRSVASQYRQFPIFSTWSGFLNEAGRQLPPLMFAALFSVSAAGIYTLAHRVLAMPMVLVGDAIGKVFFSNAAEAYREGRLGPLVRSVHEKLAHIAMPLTLVLIIAGPEIFCFVFGEQWRQAGVFARWMAPWLYMVFVTSPLSILFSVMEKQKEDLLFQIVLILVRVGAIALGAWYDDLSLALILFSLGSTFCWIGALVWISHISGNLLSIIIRPVFNTAAVSIFCAAPLWCGIYLYKEVFLSGFLILLTALLLAARYFFLLRKAF